MKTRTWVVITGATLVVARAAAQEILFDFENATLHSPLPVTLTVSDVTATFSGTGQSFSIQRADTMGFTPVGFSGYCIYPSSVFAADLVIEFSRAITNFSVLYAVDELDCDSSATMKVTAYTNGAVLDWATTNAAPNATWPTQILTCGSTNGFDKVIVHYLSPPPTGGDYGPIFMADNVRVMLKPEPVAPPALDILLLSDVVQLTWPTNSTGFVLETTPTLLEAGSWASVTNDPVVIDVLNTVTLPIEPENHFFRLRLP